METNHLFWMWEYGQMRIVHHPIQQAWLMQHVHEEQGHFGVQCTIILL
jgi:hypothetical protein